jgi:hypothetical protein
MASGPLPTGPFTCEVELRRIRAPEFVREDKQGVTYLVARGYEIAYEATLRFTGGAQLPIKARLRGELNQRIVIRDASGRPARMSGYVQGLVEIDNADGHPIFRGHYYDSRTVQSLTGDEALTATGRTVVDHFENGFGEGAYAGHAFSMGAQLIREGDGPLRGEGRGQID